MTSWNRWSDGHALAGPLQDLFRVEVTTAIGRCSGSPRVKSDSGILSQLSTQPKPGGTNSPKGTRCDLS